MSSIQVNETDLSIPNSALTLIDNAYADTTCRAFNNDWNLWLDFLEQKNLFPTTESVALYIKHLENKKAVATIERYVSSVKRWFKISNIPFDNSVIMLTLKSVTRNNKKKQQQALPFRRVHLDQINEKLGMSLTDLYQKALINCLYSTMLRRTEIVLIEKENIKIFKNGEGKVWVHRTKTEPAGAYRHLSKQAVDALLLWMDAAHITSGVIFGSVWHGKFHAKPASDNTVVRNINYAAKKAGIELTFKGHSCRVGAAIDLFEANYSTGEIAFAGGWEDEEMVLRYVQQSKTNQNAMARFMRQ